MSKKKVILIAVSAFMGGLLIAHLYHQKVAIPKVGVYSSVIEVRSADTDEHLAARIVGPTSYLGPNYFSPSLIEMPTGGPYRITCMGVDSAQAGIECDGYETEVVELERISGHKLIGGELSATVVKLKKIKAEQKH